jgi:hypothetical protein
VRVDPPFYHSLRTHRGEPSDLRTLQCRVDQDGAALQLAAPDDLVTGDYSNLADIGGVTSGSVSPAPNTRMSMGAHYTIALRRLKWLTREMRAVALLDPTLRSVREARIAVSMKELLVLTQTAVERARHQRAEVAGARPPVLPWLVRFLYTEPAALRAKYNRYVRASELVLQMWERLQSDSRALAHSRSVGVVGGRSVEGDLDLMYDNYRSVRGVVPLQGWLMSPSEEERHDFLEDTKEAAKAAAAAQRWGCPPELLTGGEWVPSKFTAGGLIYPTSFNPFHYYNPYVDQRAW